MDNTKNISEQPVLSFRATQRTKNPSRLILSGPWHLLTTVIACIVALSLSSCGMSEAARQPYRQRARDIADALGRTTNNQLAEYDACWDMNNECGYVVDFTTVDTAQLIQSRLAKVGLSAKVASGSITSNFTTIGMLSTSRASQTKLKMIGPNSAAAQTRPETYVWLPADKDGRTISIVLYSTATWPNSYSFDDKPLVGDVVEVLVRYP